VLRIISLLLPDINAKVLLGVSATYASWLLFLQLAMEWAKVGVYTMSRGKHPLRKPFLLAATLLGLSSVGLAAAVLLTSGESQVQLATIGGVAKAGLFLVCGLLLTWAGHRLANTIAATSSAAHGSATAGHSSNRRPKGQKLLKDLRLVIALFSLGFVAMAVLEAVTIADALEPQSNETTVTTLKWLALAVELVTLLTLLKLWSKAVARVTLLCRFGHMAQVLIYSHPVLSHVVPNDAALETRHTIFILFMYENSMRNSMKNSMVYHLSPQT
jgi:hypothetical protein